MNGSQPLRLVGGGLFNSLLALRLQEHEIDFELVEASDRMAGDHTWSFFATDIDPQDRAWVDQLGGFRWAGYSVEFPNRSRRLSTTYRSLRSEHLRKVLAQRLPQEKIKLNQTADGGVVATGFKNSIEPSGWQKFVGWDVRFDQPHDLETPVIMDATVPQIDGYRFLYLLPFDERTVLVEDTRYSNTPDINRPAFEKDLSQYIEARWLGRSYEILRTEEAALPIPLVMDVVPEAFGVAGGFFHPTTGYSFPFAVRVSRKVAEAVMQGESLVEAHARIHHEECKDHWFYLALNKMLFLAAEPAERWRVFARFYGFNQARIERFYGARMNWTDKLRLLAGRPPVRIGAAVRALVSPPARPAWN